MCKNLVIVKKSSPKKPVGRHITDRLPTANRQATDSFPKKKIVEKTRSKHDIETIIISIDFFGHVYRKLLKCETDILFAKDNKAINEIRFRGDLIPISEILQESYFGSFSVVLLGFTYKSPNNA